MSSVPGSCSGSPPRRPRKWLPAALALASAAALFVVATLPPRVDACGGAPPPPMCGRSTVLVKTVPFVVIAAPAGTTVFIPVRVIISAAPAGACPPTVNTTVTLNMICFPPPPPPGGVGVVVIPTPVPGTYNAVVPIFVPPGPPIRFCPIVGRADTLWGDGVVTTGRGDTVLCVVEASPIDPTVPRLDLELLTPAMQEAHPGDQRIHTLRLTNNDPTNSVDVTLSATSNQASRLPDFAPPPPLGSGDGAFSISDPGAGDNFPLAWGEDLLPDPVGSDNYVIDDGTGERNIGLNPGGAIIWLNQFNVIAGQEVIDRVSVAYGVGVNGKQVSVMLYDDPNNDGNPNDAVLLTRADARAANAGTDVFNEIKVTPTEVGGVGESFFVGVVMQDTVFPAERPARQDSTSDAGRSWVAGDSVVCNGNIITLTANSLPPALIGAFGLAGNWMIRAHGASSYPKIPCLDLPPDPMAFLPPTITRSITLCPGESRIINVATRSWPMCADGSCSEQTIRADGVFASGDPGLACVGMVMQASIGVPPEYDCRDAGVACQAAPQPPFAIQFFGVMPTHNIHAHTFVQNSQIVPLDAPVLQPQPPTIQMLGPQFGRIGVVHVAQPEPLETDSFFDVFFELHIAPKTPLIETELVELHLHSAAPALGDYYFHVNARSRVTGVGIPPTLDSFFDVFYAVSLDGLSAGGAIHRRAQILPGTITLLPTSPNSFRGTFRAIFPFTSGLPPVVEAVRLTIDPQGTAMGVPNGPIVPVTGACCLSDGQCVIVAAQKCLDLGGSFAGGGTTCAACAPSNDLCADRVGIAIEEIVNGSTLQSTLDQNAVDAGVCNNVTVGAGGVWYSLTGIGHQLQATMCSTLDVFDSQITIFCGDCDNLVCVSADDDGCGAPASANVSQTTWCAAKGVEYLILVHNFPGNQGGNFTLQVVDLGPTCTPDVICPGAGCPGERGDANCDGLVDFFDIDAFLQALFDPTGYAATFCGGSNCAVDVDCSGGVDFFDIDAFLACLFSACPPCP